MQQFMVETEPQVSLSVLSRGKSPIQFVLIHGLASNARLWDGVAEILAEWGYGSIAIDLRGHGQSSRPSDGYNHETICRDLKVVIDRWSPDERKGEHLVWLGQSWGAAVVCDFALRYPVKVDSLILVDGGLVDLKSAFDDWESCKLALTPPDLTGATASQLEQWIRQSHPDWSDVAGAGTLASMETTDSGTIRPRLSRQHHMEILEQLYKYDPIATIAKLAVPMHFLLADRQNSSMRSQRESAIAALREVSQATFDIFENSDHDLHAQYPYQVASVARDILLDLDGEAL